MNIIGLILEYNPFHNGHIHHLKEVKKMFPNSLIIGLISGNYTSRGDKSIIEKDIKTKIALDFGIDIVINNPYISIMQRADIYAYNSISLLNKMKVTDIVFGSESNDLNLIKKYALLPDFFSSSFNSDGLSYQANLAKSLENNNLIPLKSNDFLGLMYYKAGLQINPNIKFHTIKRIGSEYLEEQINSAYPSAKAIRCDLKNLKNYVEKNLFDTYYQNYQFKNDNDQFKELKYQINLMSSDNIKEIFLIKEGIENRIKKAINISNNYEELVKNCISKRYTETYIKRILNNILFNIKNSDVQQINFDTDLIPLILGLDEIGKDFLKKNNFLYKTKPSTDNLIDQIELKVDKINGFDNHIFPIIK